MSEASENWSQHLARWLMSAVLVVYAVVCAIDFFFDRNVHYDAGKYNIPLIPNLILIAIAAIGMFLFQRICTVKIPRKSSISFCTSRNVSIIATVALFCYQVASLYFAGFLTGWDAGNLRTASVFPSPLSQTLPANDALFQYFSRYPNNLLMLVLLRAQDRIRATVLPDLSSGTFYALVSMLLVSLSFFLFTRVSARLFGHTRLSLAADVVFLVLAGLSPWYMIPYSDTYGLFLCTAMLWLLACGRGSAPSLVALGLVGGIAYNIKPTCIFVIVAACLAWLLESIGTAALRRVLGGIAMLAIALVISLGAVNAATGALGISWDENARFTISHYAMMGLNEINDGEYSSKDVELSISQSTVEAREKMNNAVIKERLESYGPIGLAKHLVKKTLNCFNDGTFAWTVEGDFFLQPFGVAANDQSNFFTSYIYPSGNTTGISPDRVFCTVEQGLWVVCLAGIPLGLLRPKRGRHFSGGGEDAGDASQAAWLTIAYCVGAMLLFLLVFEARARYLYLYSGYFVLLGLYGYQQANEKFTTWSDNRLHKSRIGNRASTALKDEHFSCYSSTL